MTVNWLDIATLQARAWDLYSAATRVDAQSWELVKVDAARLVDAVDMIYSRYGVHPSDASSAPPAGWESTPLTELVASDPGIGQPEPQESEQAETKQKEKDGEDV
jgi:hypothetical protein